MMQNKFEWLSEAWDCHTHIYGPWAQFPLPADAAYRPAAAAPFSDLQALHARLGIGHGVLVQTAPYGTDHGAILAALATSGGRYRGTGIIDTSTTDSQLQAMHDGGIRGIRFNLMGHLPGLRDPATLRMLAERVRHLNWHILLHGQIQDLQPALDRLDDCGVPLVIDHMARLDGSGAVDEQAVSLLEQYLARPHCWIKVSGVDRLMQGAPPPWDRALPLVKRLLHAAPDRAIWGTDWPHPNIQGDPPDEEKLLAFLIEACADPVLLHAVLVDNPRRLYF
jgi:2-pyrone-4,6-dicarboxylate lactonase